MLVQALLLAYLTWSGTVQIWHVYLMAFFLGAANAIDLPARQAFTVDMVEGKEDLANAIGLIQRCSTAHERSVQPLRASW